MTDNLKTASQWQREGRMIQKGQHARFYRVNDERTQGRALFDWNQTTSAGTVDDSDTWTVVVDASEWEQIKAERAAVRSQPRVKVRKPQGGGCEVWCGADADIIQLLKHYGFKYVPASRYWYHPNKDAETTANAFANGKVRNATIRVDRTWEQPDGLVL